MDGDIRKREEWLRRNTTPKELDAFWERFPDTSDDWGAETKSVRDVQITLACGRWLEAYFEAFATLCLLMESEPPFKAKRDGRPTNFEVETLVEKAWNPDLEPKFKNDAKTYRACEAASTGFAALLTDPEAFAWAAPEHFDYIIETIRKVRAN